MVVALEAHPRLVSESPMHMTRISAGASSLSCGQTMLEPVSDSAASKLSLSSLNATLPLIAAARMKTHATELRRTAAPIVRERRASLHQPIGLPARVSADQWVAPHWPSRRRRAMREGAADTRGGACARQAQGTWYNIKRLPAVRGRPLLPKAAPGQAGTLERLRNSYL